MLMTNRFTLALVRAMTRKQSTKLVIVPMASTKKKHAIEDDKQACKDINKDGQPDERVPCDSDSKDTGLQGYRDEEVLNHFVSSFPC